MTNKAKIILIACIWLVIAVAMVVVNEKIFVSGETIKLEVLPLNKIHMSEFTHVPLNFKISKIDVNNPSSVSRGQRVYAVLKKGNDGVYDIEKLESECPKNLKDDEIMILGDVEYTYSNPVKKEGYVSVNYGIDNYFTPKDKLEFLKEKLANGGIAKVKVSKWGAAKVVGFEN